jgi:hypothetical protein
LVATITRTLLDAADDRERVNEATARALALVVIVYPP